MIFESFFENTLPLIHFFFHFMTYPFCDVPLLQIMSLAKRHFHLLDTKSLHSQIQKIQNQLKNGKIILYNNNIPIS